jgi:hypothetical protein
MDLVSSSHSCTTGLLDESDIDALILGIGIEHLHCHLPWEFKETTLHPGHEPLVESLELVHVRGLSGPANAHTFLLVGLGNLKVSSVTDTIPNSKPQKKH